MKIFHCDGFPLPLPPGHRFPIQKYVLLREAVVAAGLVAPGAPPGARRGHGHGMSLKEDAVP